MLKFRVEGQKLTWENPDEVVVAGTKKYLECYFEFDGDAWSGFEYIEAFFKNGRDKPIRMLLSANRIWKEDGLCLTAGDWSVYLCATTYNAEKEEIERQITSSSVSIRVLAHGQFEDAQNSFESPEIANQYIAAMQVYEEAREKAEDERVEAENARNVFEGYSSGKTYVKGNKVAYDGSSYVLVTESAQGTNPTDGEVWLLIAKKGEDGKNGDKGDKGDDGADGKDGKNGTTWIFLDFEFDIKKGENKKAKFDFNRNILYWGSSEYDGLNKDDYPNVYEWAVGDFFISANRKIIQITSLEWINSEFLNTNVVCVSEDYLTVDQVFDWNSENALSGKALAGVLETLSKEVAMVDLSNVTNADFKAKAEEAGVGGDNAELFGDAPMVFKGVVSELPETANEGEVYKLLDSKFEIYRSGVESVVDNFILENTRIQFYRYGGDTPEIVTIIAEAIAKSGGAPALVKLVLPDAKIEAVYTFTSNTYLYEDFSAEGGPVVWTFSADRAEPIEYEYAYGPCDIYYSVKVGKSYVRFGSEWIPLID